MARQVPKGVGENKLTTVAVSPKTRERLDEFKEYRRETMDFIINN